MTDPTNSASKLEPFLLISKSARGAAAVKLIQDVTSAPGVFAFSELLALPNIQELALHDQYAQYLTLLQLFSYKTYEDYAANKAAYPPLNCSQINKLKHLSLVSLSMKRRILPYSYLQSALDLSSVRALEDVIIDAIYLDLIRGKLDQKQQQFQVEWAMGRDLAPGGLGGLLRSLQAWAKITSALLTQMDHSIRSAQSSQAAHVMALENCAILQQKVLGEVIQNAKSRGRRGDGGIGGLPGYTVADDRMDIDEPSTSLMWGEPGKKKKTGQESMQKSTRKRNRF